MLSEKSWYYYFLLENQCYGRESVQSLFDPVSIHLQTRLCGSRSGSPPAPSDLWLSTTRVETPAKVADASSCTDEESVTRKYCNPDRFTIVPDEAVVHSRLGRCLLLFKWLPGWMTERVISTRRLKEDFCYIWSLILLLRTRSAQHRSVSFADAEWDGCTTP